MDRIRPGLGRSSLSRHGVREFLALLLLGPILLACAGAQPASLRQIPRGREHEAALARHCREVLLRGVFNAQTLQRSSELQSAVEEKLCLSDLTLVGLQAGFAARERVLGSMVGDRDHFLSWKLYSSHADVPPDIAARQAQRERLMELWKAEHCEHQAAPAPRPEGPPANELLGWYEAARFVREYWSGEQELVAPQLRSRWRSCVADLQPLGPRRELRCRAVEFEPPPDGAAEVFFTVEHGPFGGREINLLPIPYFPPTLKRDLEVTGVECEPPAWRKGMKFSGHRATLRCLRRSSSQVVFSIETSKGSCSASVP